MKDFSLKTGDKFVHQKTGGIYVFDGLIYSTKTNNAEVAYHNTLNESFTRDMGEFFGYTEEKKKRFLPLDEFLKEYEDHNVEVIEDIYSGEEHLIVILNVFEVNNNKYILYSKYADEISKKEEAEAFVSKLIENYKHFICELLVEDDDDFDEVMKKVDECLNELNSDL